MKQYKVNEIFYSLQGEGSGTGQAAVFIRFYGCNRACPFCDTRLSTYELLTGEEIIERIQALLKESPIEENVSNIRFVLTGGEPTLQIDAELCSLLGNNFSATSVIQVETNGSTLTKISDNLLSRLFLTISPKTLEDALSVAEWLNNEAWWFNKIEVKLIAKPLFDNDDNLEKTLAIFDRTRNETACYLQPLDTGDKTKNIEEINKCVNIIKRNPRWRLSLQTHKIIGIR